MLPSNQTSLTSDGQASASAHAPKQTMTISYIDGRVFRLSDIFRQHGSCILKSRAILNVDVLLTVHLSIILVTDQLNAQILV